MTLGDTSKIILPPDAIRVRLYPGCSLARGVGAVVRRSAIGASRLGLRARLPPPAKPPETPRTAASARSEGLGVQVILQKDDEIHTQLDRQTSPGDPGASG